MDAKLGFKLQGNPKGKPLAIIHGWGVDSTYLASIADHYNNRKVMLLDLPGYGMSMHLKQYSGDINATAELIYNTIEENTDLIAWSLSTLFAIKVCNMQPAKVTSLVTICGTPRFPADPNWPGIKASLIVKCKKYLCSEKALSLVLHFFKTQLLHINKDDDKHLGFSLKELDSKIKNLDKKTLQNGLDLMSFTDLREDFKYLKVPSLHLFGAKDIIVPCCLSLYCKTQNRSSSYIFAYSGHMPFLSEAKAFYTILDKFYSNVCFLNND